MPRNHPTVAAFISAKIDESAKTQLQLGAECGWPAHNVLTMIKQGRMKLPIDKVGALAKALETDPVYLLWLAMREYMPETLAAIESAINGMMLNPHEREIIEAYREVTRGRTEGVSIGIPLAFIESFAQQSSATPTPAPGTAGNLPS